MFYVIGFIGGCTVAQLASGGLTATHITINGIIWVLIALGGIKGAIEESNK